MKRKKKKKKKNQTKISSVDKNIPGLRTTKQTKPKPTSVRGNESWKYMMIPYYQRVFTEEGKEDDTEDTKEGKHREYRRPQRMMYLFIGVVSVACHNLGPRANELENVCQGGNGEC